MAKNQKNTGGLIYSTNPDFQIGKSDEVENTPEPSAQDLRVWLEKNQGTVFFFARFELALFF